MFLTFEWELNTRMRIVLVGALLAVVLYVGSRARYNATVQRESSFVTTSYMLDLGRAPLWAHPQASTPKDFMTQHPQLVSTGVSSHQIRREVAWGELFLEFAGCAVPVIIGFGLWEQREKGKRREPNISVILYLGLGGAGGLGLSLLLWLVLGGWGAPFPLLLTIIGAIGGLMVSRAQRSDGNAGVPRT